MNIEQAKKKIAELEPIADALYEKVKASQDETAKHLAEWNKVYAPLTDLQKYVKFTEENS